MEALRKGQWVKLICGASYQDLPAIRNLVLVYTLAGVDCIDIAADSAVLDAAWEGITAAWAIAQSVDYPVALPQPSRPWLMVSLNDGEDPHFRKAFFDPKRCPSDCPRPCVSVCPTRAIVAQTDKGVLAEKCYGCGRCLALCPLGLITAQSNTATISETLQQLQPWLEEGKIQAIELHTQVGHGELFQSLWQHILPWLPRLELISISCPWHPDSVEYLTAIAHQLSPLPPDLIWQTDGRPMSGDLGKGTTHASLSYAQALAERSLPGFRQLAGGTNHHTIIKTQSRYSQHRQMVHGVAFGGAARTLLNEIFQLAAKRQSSSLTDLPPNILLEANPDLLNMAVRLAQSLVGPWKQNQINQSPSIHACKQENPVFPVTNRERPF